MAAPQQPVLRRTRVLAYPTFSRLVELYREELKQKQMISDAQRALAVAHLEAEEHAAVVERIGLHEAHGVIAFDEAEEQKGRGPDERTQHETGIRLSLESAEFRAWLRKMTLLGKASADG